MKYTFTLTEENELERRARQHKKTDKKGARGWFVHPNPGDPEAIDRFNNSTNLNSGASEGGEACGESLIVEEIGHNMDRAQLIAAIKEYGKKYKFDKYSDAQLFRMLNRLNKEKKEKEAAAATVKKEPPKHIFSYNGSDVRYNERTGDYYIPGTGLKFPTEAEAIEFIDEVNENE